TTQLLVTVQDRGSVRRSRIFDADAGIQPVTSTARRVSFRIVGGECHGGLADQSQDLVQAQACQHADQRIFGSDWSRTGTVRSR
ncbi:MAG TPA: hypothetical protein VIY86_11355, partial [Pirellulaceae bacterium]